LEGFGLPPLEAMRYDLPVAVSNNSSCPEVLEDAALYFDPTETNNMLNTIKRGLDDVNLRQQLVAKGHEQIKKYSWQTCAQQTLNIYRQVPKIHE
ncbi:glycosyltransferase, partial [Candidatus Uhrbacteria bacterium]|nr:glycosyltransferase [Candidatus Uhrbacteria bacterium]